MPIQMSMPLVIIIVLIVAGSGDIKCTGTSDAEEKFMDTSCSSKSASQSTSQSWRGGGPTLARITKPKLTQQKWTHSCACEYSESKNSTGRSHTCYLFVEH